MYTVEKKLYLLNNYCKNVKDKIKKHRFLKTNTKIYFFYLFR